MKIQEKIKKVLETNLNLKDKKELITFFIEKQFKMKIGDNVFINCKSSLDKAKIKYENISYNKNLYVFAPLLTIKYFNGKREKCDYVVWWKKEKDCDYIKETIDFVIKNINSIYKITNIRYHIDNKKCFCMSASEDMTWENNKISKKCSELSIA